MGFLDSIKEKVTDLFDGNKDKVPGVVDSQGERIGEGIDKSGDFVDDKTGGQHSDKVDMGQEHAKDHLDGLDGKDDDIR